MRTEAWRWPDGAAQARPFGNCYWLWPGRLLAGEHPGYASGHADAAAAGVAASALNARVQALCRAGMTRFIDLTAPADPVPPYAHALQAAGGLRLSHPIVDFGVPSVDAMRAILHDLDHALVQGHGVYLHCRAGIGRTGTVAATWLVERGLDAEHALDLLQLKWQAVDKHADEPHTPETQAQREFVRAWTRLRP